MQLSSQDFTVGLLILTTCSGGLVTAAGAPKLFIYAWDRDGFFRVFPLSYDGRISFTWKPVGLGMIHGSLSNDFPRSRRTCRYSIPSRSQPRQATFLHWWPLGPLDSISTVTLNRPSAPGCTRTTCSLRSFPFATLDMYLDLQKIPDGASRTFRQPSQLPYVAPLECADISYRLT